VIRHQELVETLQSGPHTSPSRLELTLEDGRVLNTQVSPIPNIGLVLTMQDITHLKELDRIKSEFVSTVSHDLRSPLTAILGYVELLERVGPLNDQQRDFVSRVELSVHNITTLINDLLELGRIEAGFDTRKELIPFQNLIEITIEELKAQIEEKNQIFIKDVPDKLPAVLGNPIQLRQMLSNLLGNAIKNTPTGGRIVLHARAEGEQIIVQVSDTGPGIPPADQPYIFDKFYRASNISSDIPGTGLGLAIVKSVVENHLGRVWVDSALGQGTTFTIVLPISRGEI
jgi:two-component system NtrC family sensor kinase